MFRLEELKQRLTDLQDVTEFLAQGNVGAPPVNHWQFAAHPLEQALEVFMRQLAGLDRPAAVRLAAFLARYAWEAVRDQHLEQVQGIGFAFLETDPCADGEPIEKQLKNVENWLKAPTPAHRAAVKKGIDPSRQLEIWEEDLFPPADQMWLWIIAPAQLLSLAVVAGDAPAHDDDPDASPYNWSFLACVSRSALCSLKAVARKKRKVADDLTRMLRAAGAGW